MPAAPKIAYEHAGAESVGWKTADLEPQEPIQPGTSFCIRSMTRPIIGTAVQMLIDEGKLTIDCDALEANVEIASSIFARADAAPD